VQDESDATHYPVVNGEAISSTAQRPNTMNCHHLPLMLALLVGHAATAQQLALSWATGTVPANNRLKLAVNGDVFALGTGTNSAVLQRLSASGVLLWTKTLSAPTLYALDMAVDASDNIYIYVGFTTGQLDLDPGPLTTLVDPGKVYAKYTANGQFQWGFSVEDATNMSEDYGGISCDDAGNLYIAGGVGEGIYDMDPGPNVSTIEVGDFSTGSFIARYRPDGTLHWANVRSWYGGFSNPRDIAAMRDGSHFFVIEELDNGGPLSSQIDVDPGPGVFNVFNETTSLLRYDSTFAFIAQGNASFGDTRLCVDTSGAAYLMARSSTGAGFQALKYSTTGQDLEPIYTTTLLNSGNLRLGDVVADELGGCLGMYSNNCTASKIRFYKMNVSGLVDFSLFLNSGVDCTLPIGRGFDLRGGSFVMGTINNNYTVDFDPTSGNLNLPTGDNDGVVARYDWCAAAPFEPFGITALTPVCASSEAQFVVDAFGDASGYSWTLPQGWTLVSGADNDTLTVSTTTPGPGPLLVSATNACGTAGPIAAQFTVTQAVVDAGTDVVVCVGQSTTLNATAPGADNYLWVPGGATTATVGVSPTEPTTYSVTITTAGCSATDAITVVVDPCLGLAEPFTDTALQLYPVPVQRGAALRITGLDAMDLLRITSLDGREQHVVLTPATNALLLDTRSLVPGAYLLHTTTGRTRRFVVAQ